MEAVMEHPLVLICAREIMHLKDLLPLLEEPTRLCVRHYFLCSVQRQSERRFGCLSAERMVSSRDSSSRCT